MQVNETTRYIKLKKKLNSDTLLSDKIEKSINLFKLNKDDSSLHFKKIQCKKDKNRYSIRVVNTNFRILMTVYDEYVELFCVCNHDKYNLYNKTC